MLMNLSAFIGGVVRHGLTTLGGGLAAGGWISEGDIQTGVGAGMAIFGLGWSMFEKWLRSA